MTWKMRLWLVSVAAAVILWAAAAGAASPLQCCASDLAGDADHRGPTLTTDHGGLTAGALWVKRFGEDLEGRVTERVLSNGMTFIILEKHTDPTFAGVIRFKAGSVDEGPGDTGLAHMFEHMAFKGTDVIGTSDYKKERPILEEIEKVSEKLSVQRALGWRADSVRTASL